MSLKSQALPLPERLLSAVSRLDTPRRRAAARSPCRMEATFPSNVRRLHLLCPLAVPSISSCGLASIRRSGRMWGSVSLSAACSRGSRTSMSQSSTRRPAGRCQQELDDAQPAGSWQRHREQSQRVRRLLAVTGSICPGRRVLHVRWSRASPARHWRFFGGGFGPRARPLVRVTRSPATRRSTAPAESILAAGGLIAEYAITNVSGLASASCPMTRTSLIASATC
jgi:hypothetical protein